MKLRVLAVLAVALMFGALTVQGGDDKEAKKFEGTWKVTSLKAGGKDAPAEFTEKIQFVFKGDKLTIKGGPKEEEAKFKVDGSKKPKTIDITPTSGKEKDKTSEGIYKFDGKKLTLCVVAKPGDERPKEFTSTESPPTVLVVLEMAKE
jgi:uncharacterized protein (TIGR03067 family)